MREIKFRSWSERHGMEFPDNIANDIDGDECKIMQFTGLLDKNSKEIYEGDIIKNKGIVVGEVKFGEYKVKAQSKHDRPTNSLGWYVEDGLDKKSLEDLFYNLQDNCSIIKRDDQQWIEVIGNVYENKELLNDRYE